MDGTRGQDAAPDTTNEASADAAEAGDDGSAPDAADGGPDALTDAGADVLPEAGSSCAPVNATETESCGICGTQSRVCLGSPPVWQPWGACTGEADAGCVPGTQNMTACGFCGTLTMLCQNDCTWAVSECKGQPANGCAPDTVDFEPGLSCTLPQGRQRTCDSTCVWGSYGNCEAPPDVLVIGDVVGNVQSGRESVV
jgi:hypothetical protein